MCKLQVAQLRGVVDEIRAKGAELYVVGNGSPQAAKHFKEKEQLTFTLYTDPSLLTYKTAGFKSGLSSALGWTTLKTAFQAVKEGHFQGSTQGHPFQQGGVLIFGPGGKELYQYISKEAGDHPSPQEIVGVLS